MLLLWAPLFGVLADGAEQALLDDGGRYKNYFRVADELKLLPEVMSNLDFSPRDHAPPGDERAERELRDKSHWGRLYVDGWPQPIQYFRAHFGLPPPATHRVPLVLADPWDACSPLANRFPAQGGSVVVLAGRGTCTFGTKANVTAESFFHHRAATNLRDDATVTLVLVNNEPGAIHAPGPDAHDVQASVAMIAQSDGDHLVRAMRNATTTSSFSATLVPVNCVEHSQTRQFSNNLCEIVTQADQRFVAEDLNDGGLFRLDGDDDDSTTFFEYLLANFGAFVAAPDMAFPEVVLAQPETACEPLVPVSNTTAVVVMRGGGCGFVDKVTRAQAAGAAAVLVANADPNDPLLRASCHPRWLGHQVHVPVVLVPRDARDAVAAASGAAGVLVPSGGGHEAAWQRLADRVSSSSSSSSSETEPNSTDLAAWPDRDAWLKLTTAATTTTKLHAPATTKAIKEEL